MNGIEGIEWTDEDVSLIQRVGESRASASSNVCAPLERFSIWTPFADFPASALRESWAEFEGSGGKCVLNVDVGRKGMQVQVEPGADFQSAVQSIA